MAPSGCPSTAAAQSEMCKWQQHSLSLCLAKEWIFKAPSCLLCLQQQQQLLRQRKQSIYIAITTHTHTQFTVSQSFACFLCPLNECVSLSASLCVCFQFANCQAAAAAGRTKKCLGFVSFFSLFSFSAFAICRPLGDDAQTHTHTILSAAIASAGGNIQFSYLLSSSLSPFLALSFPVFGLNSFVWQHIAEWPSTLE